MRKLLLIVVLALLVPTAALAARPSSSHPTVLWVLRVTLSKFTAAGGSTKGSISITVKSSNFDSKTLKGMTLTFATDSKTKVVLHTHKPIADGDRGIVKVRAAKGSDATALQTHTAFQVIDKGVSR
jgi:hypothetical protein